MYEVSTVVAWLFSVAPLVTEFGAGRERVEMAVLTGSVRTVGLEPTAAAAASAGVVGETEASNEIEGCATRRGACDSWVGRNHG